MPARKRTATKRKSGSIRVKGRKANSRVGRGNSQYAIGRFAIPLMLSGILIACLAVIGFLGYESVTASDFFGLRDVYVIGNERTATEDIRKLVTAEATKPGVWNADLGEIREKLENFPFVKTAAVSRALPSGIRVQVVERVPAAVVHLSSGDVLIDVDGTLLAAVAAKEPEFPFVLKGWDESKTEKAMTDNLSRLKLYRKMLDEWKQFDLSKRVKEVDLADLKGPTAVIEDSGNSIPVAVAKENLGKSLKAAIEGVSGKGGKIKSVNSAGLYPLIQYRD